MKSNPNKKLTIILPIKERRSFTLRFFRYISQIKFPFDLLIADGSKKKISSEYLEILKKSKIKFHYYKFPFDVNYPTYQKKIFNSLKFIKTKYVALFSDDDFPIIYSFKKLILFLEKSKSHVACGGNAFNFDLLKTSTNGKEVYGHPINFGEMMNANSNENNDKKKRLQKYLDKMENSWHYIFRTKILLKNYKTTNKKRASFKNVDFYDFAQDGVNFLSGKIKKINTLTFLHQYHSQSEINSRLKYEKLINNKNFIVDVSNLHKKIKSIIGNNHKQDLRKFFFQSEIFFPKKNSNIANPVKKNNLSSKNYFFSKLSQNKIIISFYILYLNKIMYLNNRHIKKIMNLQKNIKIKNELNIIFNFLKKNI